MDHSRSWFNSSLDCLTCEERDDEPLNEPRGFTRNLIYRECMTSLKYTAGSLEWYPKSG